MAEEKVATESSGYLVGLFYEIIESPINLVLIVLISIFVYKIIKSRQTDYKPIIVEPQLPKLRKDFTVEELKNFDGNQSDGRVLVAVNGNVYDVTKGKRFYGPGGPYSAFGGRDASRGLATFSVTSTDKEYDDLSDLNSMEMESVREWEMQFKEKYELVGRLLRPGEEPHNYSDEEDETPTPSGEKSKDE